MKVEVQCAFGRGRPSWGPMVGEMAKPSSELKSEWSYPGEKDESFKLRE